MNTAKSLARNLGIITVATMMISSIVYAKEGKTMNDSTRQQPYFAVAQPIWVSGKRTELNSLCLFGTSFKGENAVLTIAANSFYRVFLNGQFIAHGPARGAHGYYRVDTIPLPSKAGDNALLLEVAGYNCRSFYSLETPAFVQAEISANGTVLKATGRNQDFKAGINPTRLQKVIRFSYQRAFSEIYRLDKNFQELCQSLDFPESPWERCPEVNLQPRNVGYPTYGEVLAKPFEFGTFVLDEKRKPYRDRQMTNDFLKIFPMDQLEANPSDLVSRFAYAVKPQEEFKDGRLAEGQYAAYVLDYAYTGFIKFEVKAETDCVLDIIFDEVDLRGEKKPGEPANIVYWRNSTANIVDYTLAKGAHAHLSFEPYTAKFIKVIARKGVFKVKKLSLVKYENPDVAFSLTCEDKRFEDIAKAAIRTFKHNAVDVLTDCPSRERAGWLCDSSFTAQTEKLLTGLNKVETNFLENYAYHPKTLPNLPEGMIAMCYPAEVVLAGEFIPNWSLWYLVELYQNFIRSNDRKLAEISREKVDGLLAFFRKLENSDGLLENLPGWIFVEWSKANDRSFVTGVNYPSNMLYALALESIGKLYGDQSLQDKANAIREAIRKQSFNGTFFEDNRLRKDGKLEVTGHTTETCQYYAFFTNTATPETYPELWKTMQTQFGPTRNPQTTYPNVHKSNAFIGNYLRLILLAQNGLMEQLGNECIDYFHKMAKTTGTLWEHDAIGGSLDHGFASFCINLLVEYLSGYQGVDEATKTIRCAPSKCALDCTITIPFAEGSLTFTRKDGKVTMETKGGYKIGVKN